MKRKTLVVNQGLPRLRMYSFELFGRTAARLDAGARRSKKRSGRADYGQDSSWVFWRVCAAILCVQREGDGEKESEAEKCKGRFLHWWSPFGEVIDTAGRTDAKVNCLVQKVCFGCTILGGKKKDCDLVHLGDFQ
jgi:hypothetical protein